MIERFRKRKILLLCDRSCDLAHFFEDSRQVDLRMTNADWSSVGARQSEHILKPDRSFRGLVNNVLQSTTAFRVGMGVAKSDLRNRPCEREWSSQLMRGIRGKSLDLGHG
jgi:hypothetical protein